MGKDTHALSEPARRTALEVLAANGVEAIIQRGSTVGSAKWSSDPAPASSQAEPDELPHGQRVRARQAIARSESRPSSTRPAASGRSGPAHRLEIWPGDRQEKIDGVETRRKNASLARPADPHQAADALHAYGFLRADRSSLPDRLRGLLRALEDGEIDVLHQLLRVAVADRPLDLEVATLEVREHREGVIARLYDRQYRSSPESVGVPVAMRLLGAGQRR